MHTTDNCPYCLKAKALFALHKADVQYVYKKADDWPTYPAVYRVDREGIELIGGWNELVDWTFDHDI